MPENSSAESTAVPQPSVAGRAGAGWSRRAQACLLLLNAAPFCHLAAVVICTLLAAGGLAKVAILIFGIYLLPPLLVRALLIFRPVCAGSHAVPGADFLWWWASAQGQILFCRFPFLEEALRLLPGAYSMWLRLWGGKIGRLTYWAPGVRILDRSWLEIGDNVIFGVGVRLNPHVIADDENGVARLHLSPVKIGDGCRIGGYSLLTAGAIVEPDQTLKAFSLSPPFTLWRKGRRSKQVAVPQ